MSGGVDSSVAALLIKEAGYGCIGTTLKLFNGEQPQNECGKSCCSLDDTEDARSVARKLGIPFYVFNFSANFEKEVIGRFISAYENGTTPNPCIDCNRYIKFEKLFQRMKELSMDYVVTGHYARIEYNSSKKRWLLKKGIDESKDQSYVLYSLTQEQLAHTLFPLGELSKAHVREIAEKNGFINAGKPDSQDICFVPDGDYAGFIERRAGKTSEKGNFTDTSGNIIGTHSGIIHYTIGQRKGLGISAGKPVYVCSIDPASNTVVLGDNSDLFSKELTAGNVNLISCEDIPEPIRVQAKIRYRHAAQPAEAYMTEDGKLHIKFDEPQRAVTKGQAAVLYDGDIVVGGGIIE